MAGKTPSKTTPTATTTSTRRWISATTFRDVTVSKSLPADQTPGGLVVRNVTNNEKGIVVLHAATNSAEQAAKVRTAGGKPAQKRLSDDELQKLKQQKAWDVALAPTKSIPLNAFMLWMSGNSIQIFSVMVTAMMFYNAMMAIVGIPATFARFADSRVNTAVDDGVSQVPASGASSGPISQLIAQVKVYASDPLFLQKGAFLGVQLCLCGLGLYKMSAMGLLPTATSDWLAFKTYTPFNEISVHRTLLRSTN